MTPSSFLINRFKTIVEHNNFSQGYLLYSVKHPIQVESVFDLIKPYIETYDPQFSLSGSWKDQCPDIITITPEKSIKIDDVKALQERIKYGAYSLSKCFVIISHCEQFTQEAANAFLKTLEEPKDNIVFFLLTQQLHQVIPTIRSRCQSVFVPNTIAIPNPEQDEMHISFQTFLSYSLTDRFDYCATLASDKQLIKTTLTQWTQDCDEDSSLDSSHCLRLLDTLREFRFNVNARLQLESLACQL